MKEILKNKIHDFSKGLLAYREKIKIVVIGGGALVLMEKLKRQTEDIDCFIMKDDGSFGLFDNLPYEQLALNYDINSNANAYGADVWLKFEDNFSLIEDVSQPNVEVYVPSVEYMILTKLIAQTDEDSREIKKRLNRDWGDIEFVKTQIELINFDKLEKLITKYFEKVSKKEIDEFNKTYDKWMYWLYDMD